MYRFNKLFKEHIKDSDYEYNEKLTPMQNEAKLKRMAYIKHVCKFLYENIEKTFGEDYAEFITTRVLKNDFKITAMDKFVNKDFVDTTERIFFGHHLQRPLVSARGNAPSINLINFSTSLFVDLFQRLRHTGEVELFDLLICMTVLMDKWRITEYPKFIANAPARDIEQYLRQYVKHVIFSLYAPSAEMQPFTLVILDKEIFEQALKICDYSVVIDPSGKRIKPTYASYIKCIEFLYDILEEVKTGTYFVQPKIKIYAYASNKMRPEIIELIAKDSGMSIGAVHDLFKHVNFDAQVRLFDNPEFKKAMAKLSDRLTPKKFLYKTIKNKIKKIISKEYVWYLNVVNRKLAYQLERLLVAKNTTSLEVVYVKKEWASFMHKRKKTYGEVTIDYEYVSGGCTSIEEYEQRLYKAVIDASTILQMRMLALPKIPRIDFYTLRIKLCGVEEDMKSVSYSVMSRATDYLRSTYNLPFDFELNQRLYFRDKTRLNYELL